MLHINNLSRRIAHYRPMIDAAFARVADSGWLVLGPEVRGFEAAFGTYVGVPHCVSVANGTDAIELALRALGAAAGDRVATVANAGMYTTTAMQALGARPVFMDVDPATHNVTADEVARALASGVKAVVATHLYGRAVPEIGDIARLCAQAGVPLLEDCAQAHGARLDGKHVGAFGDAASFSFYPTKNLGALGDGGAVITPRADVAERLRALRQYGWSSKYNVEVAGAGNSRLDELQAALLSGFLAGLDADNTRRRAVAARISASLRHPDIAAPPTGGADYVAHLYVIRTAKRTALSQHLRDHHIGADIHYPIPDHRQPVFGAMFADVHLPHTEQLAAEVLTLPCYPEIGDDDVGRVIDAVNGWRP